MKKSACLLLLSFTGFSAAFAQTLPDSTGKNSLNSMPLIEGREIPKRKTPKNYSRYARTIRAGKQIEQLKKGVLLVRLRTSENAIANLKKAGNEKMAATIQRQQKAANQRLMYAFNQEFKFCPVYFFYSTHSDKVLAGLPKGIFLNKDLEVDANIMLPDTNFFVAEVTELQQFREDSDPSRTSINAEVTFRALVLRDKKFHQLAKPFPFFIKAASNFPPRKRSESEMVSLLNEKLVAYYESSGRYGGRFGSR